MIKRTLMRIVGGAAFAVGTVGMVFAIFAINQVWIAAEHFGREFPRALGHLEEIVHSIHQQGQATVDLLASARERVKFISDTADELANQAERRPATAAVLETLEDDIGQRLSSAEEFVVSMQDSLRSMSNALLILDSIPLFSPRMAAVGGQHGSQLASVASSLTETADLLEQVTGTITRIRLDQAITPYQLAQARETLLLMDGELRDVQWEVYEFTRRVELTELQIKSLRRNGPPWINRVAAMATVFFVCFGFSQIHLLLRGWQLLRANKQNVRRE